MNGRRPNNVPGHFIIVSYTGNGQPISTGLLIQTGFRPRFVVIFVWPVDTVTQKFFIRVDDWDGALAIYPSASSYGFNCDGGLIKMENNGFRVGDKGADWHPNKNGQRYSAMVFS